tara:strand:- start:167 stop:592 length:426 start_codon:yes stop_codon:yes gene_type:complete
MIHPAGRQRKRTNEVSALNTGKEENFAEALEIVESGYEFMLAYAAQGRESDQGVGGDPSVRHTLNDMNQALDALRQTDVSKLGTPIRKVLTEDAEKAQAAIELVLAQPAISSQLVDNLNASIHVRALLTDLFLIDEALKSA